MFEALSHARLHGDVSRAPVRVAAKAVHDGLRRVRLQGQNLVERSQLEGILGEPVHGILLWPHLKQPADGAVVSQNISKKWKEKLNFAL